MKKMKFLSVLILSVIFTVSCSPVDESDDQMEDQLSNEPLTGQIYGESFNAEGGTADFISVNQSDVISVSLYNQEVTCEDSADTWLYLIVPREVGMHEAEVRGSINDPNSEAFSSLSHAKVEVVSFDNETVVAKVLIDRPYIHSYVNGMFEVPVCYSGED